MRKRFWCGVVGMSNTDITGKTERGMSFLLYHITVYLVDEHFAKGFCKSLVSPGDRQMKDLDLD